MRKIICIVIFSLIALCSFAFAEDSTIEPTGVYATIDTRSSVQAINILRNGTDEDKSAVAMVIKANSDKYCPAVFFSLATYLFNIDKTDDALFWLYAGRIRAQYDIKRCTDETVVGGYEELNMSVPELLKGIQFENMEKTKEIVKKAIKWDKETPLNYDPRWIALHGMGAFLNGADDKNKKDPVLIIPEKEWKDLAEKNRKEYWDALQEDFNGITPEELEQIKTRTRTLKQAKERL